MMRAHCPLLLLLSALSGVPLGAQAELRTYDFNGFFGSRTFLPIDAPPGGAWPSTGEEFSGSITIDTDLQNARIEGGTATFANAIKSMEIEIGSPDQRFVFLRGMNGTGSVSLNPGTHPGQPDNSGMQEISAAVQGDLAENALGTISMTLVGRAANRAIFNNTDLTSWDLTDIPATLHQTIAGVRSAIASAPWQGGQSRSVQLGVIRFQGRTSIEVDGQRIFNEVPQAPLASHGWGLTSNDTYSYYNFISEFYNF